MTDDSDSKPRQDRPRSRRETHPESGEEWTNEQWEALPSNPDDTEDLGYDISPWEEFESLDSTDQVMFLPDDEEKLRNTAFLVVEEESLVDLEDRC